MPYIDVKTLRTNRVINYANSGELVEKDTKVILVDGENSGEVFTIPFRGYMGSTFKILEIVSCIEMDYVNAILNYYRNHFKNSKTGSAIPHLNKNIFKSLIIGIPPREEQTRIAKTVSQLFDIMKNTIDYIK